MTTLFATAPLVGILFEVLRTTDWIVQTFIHLTVIHKVSMRYCDSTLIIISS